MTLRFKPYFLLPLFMISLILGMMGFIWVATALVCAGSVGLVICYFYQMRIHKESYWYVLLLGSLCWLIGNLLLLRSGFVPVSVNWWVGFILFTILGERLELSRFVPVPRWAQIWAHAPIILPGILKLKERPYHPLLWFF